MINHSWLSFDEISLFCSSNFTIPKGIKVGQSVTYLLVKQAEVGDRAEGLGSSLGGRQIS